MRSTCSSATTPSSRARSTTSTPSPPKGHHRLQIWRPPPTPARPRAYARMDSTAFLGFVVARRKEWDALRAEVSAALKLRVDPNKFLMDVITDFFPVDHREVRNPADLAWACVLILEATVPALANPDPDIGPAHPLVLCNAIRGYEGQWCTFEVFVVVVVLLAVTCLSNFTKSSKKSKKG
ncbi:hypothetical protein ZEAMMB73_Zm00001d008304 [Zea mays]|uniref:FRIGIDA-like protein n=1 Tax=Zea mays TaxID=4577 RepID=A0A1D6FBQ4_MAIZE|nr:hypothetical protein ZEAMMB73_Zm00001d008304 [Zea mays]